jgi:uncharacterized damage-inducible protein DinB
MQDLRYPIGKYEPQPFSEDLKNQWLQEIAQLPDNLEQAISNLNETQLQTPYRDGGWTVQQLVHHIADSHLNSYIRFKLALTENNPTITPYDEKLWAELNDVKTVPVSVSVELLRALHRRWIAALKDLSADDWNKTFYHPQQQKETTLWTALGIYAWHGKHHVAHITALRERMGW